VRTLIPDDWRTMGTGGARRRIWLTGGVAAILLGVWAIHDLGLAFHLPVSVRYDVPTVIASILAALAATGVVRFVESRHLNRLVLSPTRELEATENRYRLLFERSPAGVYRSTIDGRFLDLNDACFRMFGYVSREEHLAHNAAASWFEPAERKEFIARLSG